MQDNIQWCKAMAVSRDAEALEAERSAERNRRMGYPVCEENDNRRAGELRQEAAYFRAKADGRA